MNNKIALLIPLLLVVACNLFKPDEKLQTWADVEQIVVPDTVNYFEAFEISAEIIMDHTCEYAGPVVEETSEGCSITIIVDIVEFSFHEKNVSEWHTFTLRPLKLGSYIIRVKSKNLEDLVDSTYVR